MARGVISGVIWGGAVSVLAAAAVSLVNGPVSFPAPETTAVEVPPGSEFDRAAEDRAASPPAGDSAPVADRQAPRASAPSPDDPSPQPGTDTSPGQAPRAATNGAGLGRPPDTAQGAPGMAAEPDDPVAGAGRDAPRTSAPDADADAVPQAGQSAALPTPPDGQGAAPGAFPSDSDADARTPAPLIGSPEAGVAADAADPAAGDDGAPRADPAGTQGTQGDQPPADAPAAVRDGGADAADTPPARLTDRDSENGGGARLPTVTAPATPDAAGNGADGADPATGAGTGEAVSQDAADADADPGATAIRRHAVAFEAPGDTPLMSIVLIDEGRGAIGLEALSAFPYPLSFAVDASRPDAAARMARYRDAGFEVVARTGLPEGATPADVEVAMAASLRAVPEAVAVMEDAPGSLQHNRAMAEQLAAIVAESGHGLILFPKGLDTARKLATRAGVPAATVFRDFDDGDADAAMIRRYLDRAAFRARQDGGGVVMVGRLTPDTISALLLWGLQDQTGNVAPAPVSAMLTAQ